MCRGTEAKGSMKQADKQAAIFASVFGMMIIIMTIGTLSILRHRAAVLSQAESMNCFLHRHYYESC
jgi:hypothetical protein